MRSLAGERSRGDSRSPAAFRCPIRYVITLDADTQLPAPSARRMVETIAHPLNRVEIDPVTRARKRGFTIIQPRVSIALPGATATRFTRVFRRHQREPIPTASPSPTRSRICSAKRFSTARRFTTCRRSVTTVGDRFPAETLLSHDLIEGAHAGVALASDIELFENLPLNYVSLLPAPASLDSRRLADRALDLSARAGATAAEPNAIRSALLNRWRILDNLRRSLVPVASLLLLLFGWLISAAPGVWSLVVGLAIVIPGARAAARPAGAARPGLRPWMAGRGR